MGNSSNKMDISVRQEVYEPYRDHCKAAKTSMRAQLDSIINGFLDEIDWPGEADFKPSPKLRESLPTESPEEFSKRFAHLRPRVGVNATVLKAEKRIPFNDKLDFNPDPNIGIGGTSGEVKIITDDPSRLRVQDSSTFQQSVKEFASKNDEVPHEIKALSGVPGQIEKVPFFVPNPPRLPVVDRAAPAPGGLFSEEAIAGLAYEVEVTPRTRVSPAIGRSIPLDEIPSCIDPTFGGGKK